MKKVIFSFCALTFFAMSFSCYGDAPALKKISCMLQWFPQAQFAGYYVAYEKGIYREHGLDVDITNANAEVSAGDTLANGEVDFATVWLSRALQERDKGHAFVNIAQIVQKSALILIAKKTSGITKPQDFNGKKMSVWSGDFEVHPRAFIKKYHLDVEIIRQGFTPNLFLRDGVDIATAMWYNEYHTILNSGYNPEELTTFFFEDYGLNFPEDGIYTLEKTYKADPDMCKAFAQASLEGWKYAFDHPDEALDIVMAYMKKAYLPVNRIHQKWMLERMKDVIDVNEDNMSSGVLRYEDYKTVSETLKEGGVLTNVTEFSEFYQGR